jgi:hypothetical protein
LIQQATLDDMGAEVNLENGEKHPPARKKKVQKVERGAA